MLKLWVKSFVFLNFFKCHRNPILSIVLLIQCYHNLESMAKQKRIRSSSLKKHCCVITHARIDCMQISPAFSGRCYFPLTFLLLRPASLSPFGSLSPDLQVDLSVVWQVWVYLKGSRPSQAGNWTNRTEELQQDKECPFSFVFIYFLFKKGAKENIFFATNEAEFTKETSCNFQPKLQKLNECVVTEDTAYITSPLLLSSSQQNKNVIHFKSSPFSWWTYFWYQPATCLRYLHVPHYICSMSGLTCGKNCFLIKRKKKASVND